MPSVSPCCVVMLVPMSTRRAGARHVQLAGCDDPVAPGDADPLPVPSHQRHPQLHGHVSRGRTGGDPDRHHQALHRDHRPGQVARDPDLVFYAWIS